MAVIPDALMVLYNRLEDYLGKHISEFCSNGYKSDAENHCAHFVSHVKSYTFGYTCKGATGGTGDAANLRVHEVFARCREVGLFSDRGNVTECLAFVTKSAGVNLNNKSMANIPKKHIGIYSLGGIYHYSNSRHKVWKDTPDEFAQHYTGDGFQVYYGTFPL
jgi:hypothetical protein